MNKVKVYLLHGDAVLLLEEALSNLIKKMLPQSNTEFNFDVFDAETTDITHIIAAANTLPVFAEQRLVVVRRVERYLENKKNEDTEKEETVPEAERDDAGVSLLKYVENPNPHATLIMTATRKLDARKKTYKELSKLINIELFSEPQHRDTTAWLQERTKQKYQKRLSFDAAQFLIAAVGRTSGILATELEKVALYCLDKKEININDVKALTADNSNIIVFDFIDALVEKRPQQAINILQQLIKIGEHPSKLIVILAKHIRSLISVKALKGRGEDKNSIAKLLGAKSDFVVQKYLRQENHFTMDSLIKALNFLSDADVKTKMGQGDAHNLFYNAIINIAGVTK